jgi:hypothetical protein
MFHANRTPLKLAAVSLGTAALAAASFAPTAGAVTQGTSQAVAPKCVTLFGVCLKPPRVVPTPTGGTFTSSGGQRITVVLPSGPTGPGAACTGGLGWIIGINC